MGVPTFDHDMKIIQKLPDEPNDVGGLSPAELKAKFDEGGEALKAYINQELEDALESLCPTVKGRMKGRDWEV